VVARVRRPGAWLVLVLLAGAAGLAWQLGSSSLFVDEGFSWLEAIPRVSDGLHIVRELEITPPAYFLGLHVWVHAAGSDAEWVLRFPSLVAGIGLLAAIAWLATELGGRRAGLIAATLASLSPLVMTYGQQARAYVFVMLALTLIAIAALRASRVAEAGESPRRWLVLAGVLLVLALATSYTTLLVAVPLLAWIATRRALPLRGRISLVAVAVATQAALFPLLHHQAGAGHEPGLRVVAAFTARNLLRVAATPFDAHYTAPAGLLIIGLLTLLATYGILATRTTGPARSLLLPCVLVPFLVTIVATLSGHHVLLSRYTAVSAPFAITGLAVAAGLVATPVRVALVGPALLVAAVVWADQHRARNFYPDSRGMVAQIARTPHPVLELWSPLSLTVLDYDFQRAHLTSLPRIVLRDPRAAALLRTKQPIWLLSDRHAPAAALNGLFASSGYRATRIHPGYGPVQVSLLTPTSPAEP
jgi:4-amino-4-deoxy-L-arabinose transferase-like glycosyltransferase